MYAGAWAKGVFRSDDAGVNWKPIRDGLGFYDSTDEDGRRVYGEVRRILNIRGEIITVMYHRGTYTSTDRGQTWHDVSQEWPRGDSILSVMEFDGYLWSAASLRQMFRSPDGGQTWEGLPRFEPDRVNDWAVLHNRLYVAGEEGIGRWNERAQIWEYPMEGLPTDSPGNPVWLYNLTVHEGRLFVGLNDHCIYVFDAQAETWFSIGLDGLSVYALLSYKSSLYAGTGDDGIYRAEIPRIQPHGKVVTTWAHVKQGSSDRTGSAIEIPFQPHLRD